MGFFTFGGGKKQDSAHADMADLEKLRTETSLSRRQGTHSKRDLTTTRGRAPSVPQPPRSRTAPVLAESKSAQNVRAAGRFQGGELYQHMPTSQASLNNENLPEFHGPPTLFAKRTNVDAQSPRPKTKRKTDEYEREREIRAMASSPIPIPSKRPSNFRSESPLLREKRTVSSGIKRQSSEVSLPVPGSMSELDFNNPQNSYKIGILAALSPRPNIQFDSQARTASGKQVSRGKAIQKAIEEEDISDLKRIDELADDLDAGGLRELMERDRKRREKKKEMDKERMLRRLERRALKDREEETRRARTEAYVRESSPANVERQAVRKGESSKSRMQRATKKSTTQKSKSKEKSKSPETEKVDDEQPSTTNEQTSIIENDLSSEKKAETANLEKSPFTDDAAVSNKPTTAIIRNPFEDEQEITPEFEKDVDELNEEVGIPARSPLRPVVKATETAETAKQPEPPASIPLLPPPRSTQRPTIPPKSASRLSRGGQSDKVDDVGQDAQSSDRKAVRMSTWTNFFSKGTRRKLATVSSERKPETEFSNTTRESLQRKQLPPVVTERTYRSSGSGTPQRTLSKFREDLPHDPVSTPGAESQTPASLVSPVRILDVSQQKISLDENDDNSSIQRSIEIGTRPTSSVTAPLPQSMASVDSEASWLSGRPSQRRSKQGSTMPVVDDDPSERPVNTRQERQVLPDSEEQDTAPAVPARSERRESIHADARRRPTVVNQGDRIQSHAGLLNDEDVEKGNKSGSNEDEEEVESPGSVEIIDAPLMRAQSVEYKGHARAVSAGSVQLLNIKRSSTHSDLGRPRSPTTKRKSALGSAQQDETTPATPTTVD